MLRRYHSNVPSLNMSAVLSCYGTLLILLYVSGQVAMLLNYWDALGVDSSSIGSYHYQDLEAMEEQGNNIIALRYGYMYVHVLTL